MPNEPTGMDSVTGKILVGWDYVLQEITQALTTAFFERCMRPYVGSNARRLWGELANTRTAMRFRWAVILAMTSTNPRTGYPMVPNFEPMRVDQVGLDRTGDTVWVIDGFYIPRGHLGDRTRAGRRRLTLAFDGRGGPSITG
jgi:phage baseplate assembly protein W